MLFDHFRQFCKTCSHVTIPRRPHGEIPRVSLWEFPGGSHSAMGKGVKRENFGAGAVSPCSGGKVQSVPFPSWGEQRFWEGASKLGWDFALSGICLSLNGILLWFLPSSNKQKAHRFTLGLCSHIQTAWGPSQLFKKRGTVAPYRCMEVCVYIHTYTVQNRKRIF